MGPIRAIHQLVAGFQFGDAITHHALRLQNLFRSWGYAAEIFADGIQPKIAFLCSPLSRFPTVDSAQTLVILHYSIHSEASHVFLDAKGRKVMVYHNITPPEFFEGYSEQLQRMVMMGREHLGDFLGVAEQVWAVSPFNGRELEACGYRDIRIVPLLLDFRDLDLALANPYLLRRYRDGTVNLLFVGRLAPNKRHFDLLRAFTMYRTLTRKDARLFIVGAYNGLEPYFDRLRQETIDSGFAGSVIFTGVVSFSDLKAYYRMADLFVCLSEHEGFCIPLIEAMRFGVPIVAYAAGAVSETLGGAGVLLRTKDPVDVAETLARLVDDQAWRSSIMQAQRERVKVFARERVIEQIRGQLRTILEGDVDPGEAPESQ